MSVLCRRQHHLQSHPRCCVAAFLLTLSGGVSKRGCPICPKKSHPRKLLGSPGLYWRVTLLRQPVFETYPSNNSLFVFLLEAAKAPPARTAKVPCCCISSNVLCCRIFPTIPFLVVFLLEAARVAKASPATTAEVLRCCMSSNTI